MNRLKMAHYLDAFTGPDLTGSWRHPAASSVRAFALFLLALCCPAFPESMQRVPAAESAVATAPATATSQSSCSANSPFTARVFLEKFAALAAETDQFEVPKRFEETFGMKLQGTRSEDGRTFHLWLLDECSWYTRVSIFTHDDLRSKAVTHVAIIVGNLPKILRFGDPNSGECLTPQLMDSVMEENKWDGLWGQQRDFLTYTRHGTRVEATQFGGFGQYSKRYVCVGEIQVEFTQTNGVE